MTEPNGLAAALAALQTQLPHVKKANTAEVVKDGRKQYTYAYADLTDVSEAILPVMAKLELSFTCAPGWSAMSDGSPARFVLRYTLMHAPSGDRETGLYPLPDPDKHGPQILGQAITYARRYALCAVTGLAPGGDDQDAGGVPPPGRSARSLTPAQQKAARTPDPARGQTPTAQREARARRAEEVRAVAAARTPGRPADRGPLPDADNVWQEAAPEDRPGTASPGQKRAIEALLTKAGCATGTGESVRDERHAAVLKYLPELEALKSMNHLSFNEAAAVIRGLSADTGDEKMPQAVPDHAQRAANDWPEDPWAGDAPDWTRS